MPKKKKSKYLNMLIINIKINNVVKYLYYDRI